MNQPVLVRSSDAEVLGAAPNRTWLLADAADTGGVMNVVRTTLGPGVDGPPPHFHRLAPEMFYLLDGRLRVLVGDEVVVLTAGDYLLVPPGVVHAWGTLAESGADVLIVKAPGENRFDYFRLGDRIRRGAADPAEVLATQEEFDNHFTASPVWTRLLAGEPERAAVVDFPGGARDWAPDGTEG
ncbi:cupin domain-containing protein [Amycolatopsis sp. NPDC050768]|uniref:cupin domain-containing protein n=1 Tax=Amycolatopsis sp. NPDC050768 TaxID=3154839 RepID=UPI0033D79D10